MDELGTTQFNAPVGLEQGELVRVTWVDSGMALWSNHGWESVEDIKGRVSGELLVETTGYYLGEAEHSMLLIAQSWDAANDNYLNAQAIWVPCLRQIERLSAAS